MDLAFAVQIGRETLYTALLLSLPTVVVSLAVGLLVSIFQTVTSIQEQTLSFAPRIVAVGVAIAITLPWSLQVLTRFSHRMFMIVAEVG